MEKNNGLIAKWGNEIFDDGVTNAPQCFMRYGRRFVKSTHFQLICCIISYQYGSDAPYPSRETIANDMGISVKRVGTLLQELEEDGHIEIYWRYEKGKRSSSEYVFKPLLDKCLEHSRNIRNEKEKGTLKIKKKTSKKETKKETKGTKYSFSKNNSLKEQSIPLGLEQSIPLGLEQSIPLGLEHSVPSNKELEERNVEERNINNVCVEEQPNMELLKLIDSRSDLQTHKQKILGIYNKKKNNKTFKEDVFIKTLEIIDLDMKTFSYLENALMNNLKRGYVKEFDNNKKSVRVEKLPEWFDKNKTDNNNSLVDNQDSESPEQKRARLLKNQEKYKKTVSNQ